MPRRKSKSKEEVRPEAQPTTPPTPPVTVENYVIKEATWEEFKNFTPQRRERPKSKLRKVYEMAMGGKVVKLEGLTRAQVRAVLAAVNLWNYMEKEITGRAPVQVKYDMKAGVVYLAPAEKPTENQ